MLERGELGEEKGMARENFGTELLLEKADAMLEFFGGGSGGARG